MILRVIYYFLSLSFFFFITLSLSSAFHCSISSFDSFIVWLPVLAHQQWPLWWPNTSKIEENLIRITINKWLKNPPFTIIRKVLHRFNQTFYLEQEMGFRTCSSFHKEIFLFFVIPCICIRSPFNLSPPVSRASFFSRSPQISFSFFTYSKLDSGENFFFFRFFVPWMIQFLNCIVLIRISNTLK